MNRSYPLDQSSIILPDKIIIDPFEYKNLALASPTNETPIPSNDYEALEPAKDADQNIVPLETQDQIQEPIPHVIQDKSPSVEDISRTSDDQTSSKYEIFLFLFIDLSISLST